MNSSAKTGQPIESSEFIYIRFYRDDKRVAEKLRQRFTYNRQMRSSRS